MTGEFWITEAAKGNDGGVMPALLIIYTVDMVIMFAVSLTPQNSLLGAFPIMQVEPEYRQGIKLTQYTVDRLQLKKIEVF